LGKDLRTKQSFPRSGFHICLPPRNEQRRIVKKIQELQKRSRRARESLETIPLLPTLTTSSLAADSEATSQPSARKELLHETAQRYSRVVSNAAVVGRERDLCIERKGKYPTGEKVEKSKSAGRRSTPKTALDPKFLGMDESDTIGSSKVD